ncbi:hypothetical protein PNOK_0074700 [Pyrrhoderma noxium]|uniref:DUF3074 domain-containing protein n=1 Tax=Pyrrhoderma noxium TaxID=2282107 RepID=A0A286UVP9_9AGAM|nr:hypothetical protein PNOK_0074700 [Pyrrhoderma noxium]
MIFGSTKLNITPVKVSEIPPEGELLQAGRELIKASQEWKQTKVFCKGLVQGITAPKASDDDEPWFGRVSVHDSTSISFDELWFGLGTKKPEHESKFVHNIDGIKLLKQNSDQAEIWNIHYKFSPPISNRTFTVLQVIELDTSSPKRSGLIVSIPIDTSPDAELHKQEIHGVRGRYVSVERIQELEDGKIEWRMVTSSIPGGSIPSFVVHTSLPGQIANDVPLFLKWYESDKEYFKQGTSKPESEVQS